MYSKGMILAAVAAFTSTVAATTGDMTWFHPVSPYRASTPDFGFPIINQSFLLALAVTNAFCTHRVSVPAAEQTMTALLSWLSILQTMPTAPTAGDGSPSRATVARPPPELLTCAPVAAQAASMSRPPSLTILLRLTWAESKLTGSSSRSRSKTE